MERFSVLFKRDFNLTKKPGLVWIATEFFQCNYILSLALFFTITLIREYIIQHQDTKSPLQQSYHKYRSW
jgi:hypothetical protein